MLKCFIHTQTRICYHFSFLALREANSLFFSIMLMFWNNITIKNFKYIFRGLHFFLLLWAPIWPSVGSGGKENPVVPEPGWPALSDSVLTDTSSMKSSQWGYLHQGNWQHYKSVFLSSWRAEC